ncbi:MAG TPA: T9SS type A sorting domain-containing protein [Bacteroidales bacterium]|nr:T9SS type A sorting domain-containing protein [Bacteroidales bacterium]
MKKILFFFCVIIIFSNGLLAQWIQQASGFPTASRGIWNISIVDQNIAWASAYDGSGLGDKVQDFTRTINGGGLWQAGTVTPAAGLECSELFAVSDLIAYALFWGNTSGGQAVFKTVDGGATWVNQPTALFSGSAAFPNIIYFWDANNGICLGDPNGGYMEIYTTTDGGTNWVRTPSANIPAIITGEYGYNGGNTYDVIGDTIWFGTNKGRVYRSTDRGLNWTVATTGLSEVSRLVFKDHLNGLAIYVPSNNSAPTLKRTTDGGTVWTSVNYTGPLYSNGIAYASGNIGYYVSTGANINAAYGSSYSLDDGNTWVTIDTLIQHTAVAFLDNATGYSGGFNNDQFSNGIFKWTGISVNINDNHNFSPDIIVFPNPSYGNFTITFSKGNAETSTIKILDITGKEIKSVKIDALTPKALLVDISSCSSGLYLIEISTKNTTLTKKIFKK